MVGHETLTYGLHTVCNVTALTHGCPTAAENETECVGRKYIGSKWTNRSCCDLRHPDM